ncbi:terminase large subunit [Nocardia otitidiscaviarum]|nr:terminase large subunit [Nocardia otitidiscaviarum]MCP9621973.1 terminase large subunit [Nocardia otitidiscaviarum]
MATKTTRSSSPSPHGVELPDAEELDRLKLSPEVAYYLTSRGIPLPDCPPRWKTPEPRDEPGARFDPERVDNVLTVFRNLRHTKGRLAGRPLIQDPWQVAYLLAPVFGWGHYDDDLAMYVRIIRTVYVELPRKNGKSTIAGGIGIYLTTADGEEGAQVIAAATRLDQAQFVFAPIKQLAEKAPALRRHVKTYKAKIVHPRTGSYERRFHRLPHQPGRTAPAGHDRRNRMGHHAVTNHMDRHRGRRHRLMARGSRGSRRHPGRNAVRDVDSLPEHRHQHHRRLRVGSRASRAADPEPQGDHVLFRGQHGDRVRDPHSSRTTARIRRHLRADRANDPAVDDDEYRRGRPHRVPARRQRVHRLAQRQRIPELDRHRQHRCQRPDESPVGARRRGQFPIP